MKARKTRILADLPAHLLSRPRTWIAVGVTGLSLMGVVAATAVAPDTAPADILFERVVQTLPTPVASIASAEAELPFLRCTTSASRPATRCRPSSTACASTTPRRSPTFRAPTPASAPSASCAPAALAHHRRGMPEGRVMSFTLPIGNTTEQVVIERGDAGLALREAPSASQTTMVEMRSGTVTHSLSGATDAAGLPDNVATQLATIFGTWIDFHADLRKGDRFNVVHEAIYEEGNLVRAGRILAAEFINNGERHAVVLYRGPSGKEQYYSDDGRSLQQGFLRSPLEFSRVSSNFGSRRLHPIHGSWRSHNGTDFSAPVGTPTGHVRRHHRVHRHPAWLRQPDRAQAPQRHHHPLRPPQRLRQGLAKGQSVSQGDLIGYVGCTGWCTGPHLHYEVRIRDVPADPMTVALPMADSFNDRELAAWRNTAHLRQRFALLNYEPASAK